MGSLPPTESTNSSPPGTLKEITYDGARYKIASEGSAEILVFQTPKDSASTKASSASQSVFYNPIQQYNRDLSVLAIKAFGDDLAAVRKGRYQERSERFARDQQKGKKRKRPQAEASESVEDSSRKRNNGQERLQPATGASSARNGHMDEERPVQKARQYEGGGNQSEARGQSGSVEIQDPTRIRDSILMEEVAGDTRTDVAQEQNGNPPAARSSFRILDALSATGLRALRYAKEIPMATSITANDLSPSATASIKLNVEHNKLSHKIIPTTGDAIEHLHHAASLAPGAPGQYHVIDLDPYGTAAPFLDAAVRAIAAGGLLCVTCTDAGVFASAGYLEKTYSQYGGLPLKGPHAHEGGLRLILHSVATSAARYGLAIEPLLSLSIDFYARVFVRVHRSPAEVKFLASKTMVVYNCDAGCGAWSTQYLARAKEKKAKNGETVYNFTSALAPSASTHCEHCGFKTHHAGPMWGGPLHNPHFIQRILDMLPSLDKQIYGTIPRIEGMLSIALHETLEDPTSTIAGNPPSPDRPIPKVSPAIRSNHPFFFLPSTLARVLHCVSPSDAAIRGALLLLGYRTTRSHTKAGSIATDAPWSTIWEIMREWVRQKSPIKNDAIAKGTAGWGIFQKDRSRSNVIEAQRQLREAVDNQDIKDLKGLERDIKAALSRISKLEEARDEGNVFEEAAGEGVNLLNAIEKEGELSVERSVQREHSTLRTSTLKIVFDEELGKEPQGKRMVRYQTNPRPDWGPMNRAKADH